MPGPMRVMSVRWDRHGAVIGCLVEKGAVSRWGQYQNWKKKPRNDGINRESGGLRGSDSGLEQLIAPWL